MENYEIKFERKKHVNFLKLCFRSLKKHTSMEAHKITILYFVVGGLKILNELDEEESELAIRFVLNNSIVENGKIKGFRGGNFSGWSFNNTYNEYNTEDKPHIAATYSALCILSMCGLKSTEKINERLKEVFDYSVTLDDYVLDDIIQSQLPKGNIRAQNFDTEEDVRFFYCAMAVFHMMGKDSENIKKLLNCNSQVFLDSLQSYEGGFSMNQSGESNAGTTFCTVASYKVLDTAVPNSERLTHWLNSRNNNIGVNGRTNKTPDSCYSYWVMGTLNLMGELELFDRENTINFILNCQTIKGGFSKHINFDLTETPDVLHTYYSLASLSLLKYEELTRIDPILGVVI